MGYLFFYIERFLWILWILCEIYLFSRWLFFLTQNPRNTQIFLYEDIFLMWGDCILNPQNGTCFTVPAWRTESVLPKNFTSLSAWCWAGKSSYRQGSVLAWNQPWTWASRRMTICQHRQDKTRGDDGCSKCTAAPPGFFYNPLIINSVFMSVSVGVFYRNSAMTCVRTSLFLAINFNKNLYTALGVSSVSSVLSPKMKDCF